MSSPEDVEAQQKLLAQYRRTLHHQLTQRASLGPGHVTPVVQNGIDEARAEIRRIKKTLEEWHISVENNPDDEEANITFFKRDVRRSKSISVLVLSAVLLIGGAIFVVWNAGARSSLTVSNQPTQVSQATNIPTTQSAPTSTATSLPQGTEAPTTISLPTQIPSPTPDISKLTRIERVREDPCTAPAVLPTGLKPAKNLSDAEFITNGIVNGEWKIWPKAPDLGFDENRNLTARFNIPIRVTNTQLEGEWIRLSNTFEVVVEVKEDVPNDVGVLYPCEGAGTVRETQDKVLLTRSANTKEYKVALQYKDGDFFTLSSGEFEEFRIGMTCETPGAYLITINIPFTYKEQEGTLSFRKHEYQCPNTFQVYNQGETFIGGKPVSLLSNETNVKWVKDHYELVFIK